MTINKEIIRRTSFFLQAIVEGKTIQMNEGAVWKDIDIDGQGIDISMLISCPFLYRIKPEVKYLLLRTQKSAGRRCQNINRLGG